MKSSLEMNPDINIAPAADLLSEFQNFILINKLIQPDDKVLLAVSGGVDSSVMIELFSKSKFKFSLAHCNFCLRGNDSDEDENFIRSVALENNFEFYSKRFETIAFAEQNKLSIQEAARTLRYEWFKDILTKFDYQKIATAHHLDDSIETFFINLQRGTGTAGLKGIPLKNKNIIRPVLFAKKESILNYANENKISYREDISNSSDDYLRNRIRHNLIPFLKYEIVNFESMMENTIQNFAIIDNYLKQKTEQWKSSNTSTDQSGNININLEKIYAEKNPAEVLSSVLYSYGITGIETEKILNSKSPGKFFDSKKYRILFDRNAIILTLKSHLFSGKIQIDSLPYIFDDEKLEIKISSDESWSVNEGENVFIIDSERITFPLLLRRWKEGDYFYPLGMSGKKKISDFYTDIKLNRFEKDKTFLLLSGTDIVCILGHRIDDRFKVTETTKKIIRIEFYYS